MKKRVLLAMSGGVDSSVAAYILQEKGYEVIGATIKTWSSDECKDEKAKGCCSLRDIQDARNVARNLDIPYYVLDLSEDFKEKVIDYFVETYLDAKTPNPCIQCNNHIKFGIFLKKAQDLNADYVATGHYARRAWDEKQNRWYIREGIDLSKDQSYVLFGLNQEQIEKTLLPVGEYSKKQIRQMAHQLGLKIFDKPDSQEICFVNTHYSNFIESLGVKLPGQGEIVDLRGQALGKHDGYHRYTIGQRKRLNITDKTPYYVVRIRPEFNQIVVGKKEDVNAIRMKVEKMNWMTRPIAGEYSVKIRSNHNKSQARLIEYNDAHAVVEFCSSEPAITPGQAAVIYDGDAVVGGGWIG